MARTAPTPRDAPTDRVEPTAAVWAAVEIRDLRQSDGDELRALWRACGIRDRPGDDDASLAAMASRNPGLCIVGREGDRVVGLRSQVSTAAAAGCITSRRTPLCG